MKILFLSPRLPRGPSSPRKGDQARAYHLLEHLGKRHQITLLCFCDSDERDEDIVALNHICYRVIAIPRSPWPGAKSAVLILRGRPFQSAMYFRDKLKRRLEVLLAEEEIDILHVHTLRMAPYVENISAVPRVIDFVDALSLNFKRRAGRDAAMLKLLLLSEAHLLSRYERWLCSHMDRSAVSSQTDRNAIGDYRNLSVIRNGVDVDSFWRDTPRDDGTIVFAGTMDYFPNADAVRFFANDVFPRVQRQIPGVRFRVIGSSPGAEIREMGKRSGVEIVGYIADLAGALRSATVAVCPTRTGSGTQFKILEAMAAETPVVASSMAAQGLSALGSTHLLTADDPDKFADAVVRLVRSPELQKRLASGARRFVEEEHSWKKSADDMEELYVAALKNRG